MGRETKDPIKYKPEVGGTEVDKTAMLSGKGALTAAQNDTNETVPYQTGKLPVPGNLGAEIVH